MSRSVDAMHRRRDRSVVEETKVLVPALRQQGVGLGDVDAAAEEVREHAVHVPWAVPFEPAGKSIEEQVRNPGGEEPLCRRPVIVRHPVSGQERALPIDHHAAPGLIDVRGLAEQVGVGHHLGLATPGHDHHLHAGAVAGLQCPRLVEGEVAVGVAKQRAMEPEQGAVQVGVNAAQRHGRATV